MDDDKFTTGRGGGTGSYSYRYASMGRNTVHVSQMPDEYMQVRVVFSSDGEMHTPIMKLDERDAKLLRVALNALAKDLLWEAE